MKNRECKWYVYCSSGQTLDSLEEKELGRRGFLPGLLTGGVGLGAYRWVKGLLAREYLRKPGTQHLLSSSHGPSDERLTV